jgi:uncharacterized YigZ family protein
MEIEDTYNTILKESGPSLFKDKNSKFYGYAFPVLNENEIRTHITNLKKDHYGARHWCFAYQLGTENITYRVNDDGEPNNSAGMPIYGQIQSFNVTYVLVVVIRYYGGVKLGVGGLINAYKTAAQLCLESSKIIKKTINVNFQLNFEYKYMSAVMRLLKENNCRILHQALELDCLLEISVRKGNSSNVFNLFEQFYGIEIIEL